MPKKRLFLFGTLVTLLGGGVLAGVGVAVKHEPAFFSRADIPASPQRRSLSKAFESCCAQLYVDLTMEDRKQWQHTFTEAQINSFFEEDFVHHHVAESLRHLGISNPRVLIDDDKLRVAFRYGSGIWSTIVSYDLRIWTVPRERNMIAVEILSRRVGALPVSSQSLMSELSELARRQNMDMTLYREEGHPIALIRFQADTPRPHTNLTHLQIAPATVILAGGSPPEKKAATSPQGN